MLTSLSALGDAVAAQEESLPLHPVQLEVVFRQVAHALAVLEVWGPSGTSEETLDAALRCLDALLVRGVTSGSGAAAELLFAPSLRPTTGQMLSSMIGLAAAPMHLSGARRAACVRGVRRLCGLPGVDAAVLAFFLPGLMSRLASLATNDEKAPTPLLVELLAAACTVLLGCVTDDANAATLRAADLSASPAAWVRALHEQARSGRSGSGSGGGGSGRGEHGSMGVRSGANGGVQTEGAAPLPSSPVGRSGGDAFRVDRTSAWLEDSSRRLAPLLSRLCVAAAGGSWRARHQLVSSARALLLQCALSLRACVPTLLEHVYAATRDPYPHVARAAAATLRAVGRRFASSAALTELVRDGFETQLRALPAAARSVNEPSKARAFAVLSAQLELLHATGGLRRLLGARLDALSTTLLGAVAMAPSDQLAIETRLRRPRRMMQDLLTSALPVVARSSTSARRAGSDGAPAPGVAPTPGGEPASAAAQLLRHARYSAKPHAHLRDGRTIGAAVELCRTLGALGPLSSIVHHLLPAITTSPRVSVAASPLRAPTLWVLDQVLRGARAGPARAAEADEDDAMGARGVSAQASAAAVEGADAVESLEVAGEEAAETAEEVVVEEAEAEAVEEEAVTAEEEAASGGARPSRAVRTSATHGEVEEVVLMVLRELLAAEVWNAPSALSATAAPSSLSRQQATLLEHEALIEVVGSAFELLAASASAHAGAHASAQAASGSLVAAAVGGGVGGVSSVQVALRLSLFPLLERLGDRAAALSAASEITLCRLCVALGEPHAVGSVAQLLGANADFLLDALGGRLRHASRYPHTSQAVQAVIEFGGERAIPIAGDLLDDVRARLWRPRSPLRMPQPRARRLMRARSRSPLPSLPSQRSLSPPLSFTGAAARGRGGARCGGANARAPPARLPPLLAAGPGA